MWVRAILCAFAFSAGVPGAGSSQGLTASEQDEWSYYGGDRGFTRYSPLDQIHGENVAQVEILWRRPAVDPGYTEQFPDVVVPRYLLATPIYLNGVLYAPNGVGLVEAFDPASGATLWVQEPFDSEEVGGRAIRGLDHWEDGGDRRLFTIRREHLYALDRSTGEVIRGFGEEGRVHLLTSGAQRVFSTSGPIVVGDVVVVGGILDGAGDSGSEWKGRPPEDIRGFDARTGEHLWTFHVVPREGEYGTDTWGNESWRESGDLGMWCCLSADEELGYVYVPLSAPTAAYYGGHRPGENLFSNSLVALNAATGERVWHFQSVRHDLWEYDLAHAPTLGDITVEGRRIPAVMQPSKTGFLYVLDRRTGEPVWPMEERPVPASTVPGEQAWPTQPVPTRPPPFDRQGLGEEDLIDFTPELRERALEAVEPYDLGPIFTPPSLITDDEGEPGARRGTLGVPGVWGAGNWNTGAFDPETGMYYAASHTFPAIYGLVRPDDPEADMTYWRPFEYSDVPTVDGLPVVKPPWGRITALDLQRGEEAWMVANGPGPLDHPLLAGLDLPYLGFANRPAPLVTRSLLFLGEGSDVVLGVSPDMWGRTFRAYDKATGTVIWEKELPSGTTSGPMTYMHEGKQYILVPVGSSSDPPEWVALGLPQGE